MSRSKRRSKCPNSCPMCKPWKHGFKYRRPTMSAETVVTEQLDDAAQPEEMFASCGDPSCGDKCGTEDHPWFDGRYIVDATGAVLWDAWAGFDETEAA